MSDMVLYKIGMDGTVEEVCRETIQDFMSDEDMQCIIPISKNPSGLDFSLPYTGAACEWDYISKS